MPEFLREFANILLWTLWIFVFVAYLFVLFRIVMDIFRDREMGGGMKAVWLIALLFFPVVTALIYLIARGRGMAERDVQQAEAVREAQKAYVRDLATEAGTPAGGPMQELKNAKDLLDAGVITQEQFEAAKAKALAG
jgi:type VI protein secretion system component VasK